MKKTSFPSEGILAALAIPTDARGRVMKSALAAHLDWLRERGVHGVLGLGSTSGFPFFTLEERKAVLELVAELAAPLPVIANISDIQPRVVAELGRFARRLKLSGVALMPPSFFPVSPPDQLAFFERAAEIAQLPVLLYNFPELTGNRISLETIAAFAERQPMAGIKQSGGEFSYHEQLIALGREKTFSVFSGADTRLPEAFALGAAGCIGGLVNFVPEYMLEIFRVHAKGGAGDTTEIAARLKEVGKSIDRATFPWNIAAGIAARGFEPGEPKSIVSPASQKTYATVVAELRANFASWGLMPAGIGSTRAARRSRRRAA